MMETISSVFFVGMRPAPARRVRAAGGHVAIQQLLTSSSNCMSFQVQEVGQQGVARSRYCRRVSGSKVVGRIMLEFRLALTSNRIMEIENARFIGHLLIVFGLTACRYRAEPHVLCAAMERTLTRQRPHRRRVPRLVIPSQLDRK